MATTEVTGDERTADDALRMVGALRPDGSWSLMIEGVEVRTYPDDPGRKEMWWRRSYQPERIGATLHDDNGQWEDVRAHGATAREALAALCADLRARLRAEAERLRTAADELDAPTVPA